jgi:hypothetical protein
MVSVGRKAEPLNEMRSYLFRPQPSHKADGQQLEFTRPLEDGGWGVRDNTGLLQEAGPVKEKPLIKILRSLPLEDLRLGCSLH